MQVKPIKNDEDYRAALKQIEGLMNAETDTPEGDMLDVLTTLVEAYERKAFPIEEADPIEVVKFYMEQNGLTPKDLVPIIGQSNRVHEILNYKRPLTLSMIRKLHEAFGISVDALIKKSALLQEV